VSIASIVLLGHPGAGKTALLGHAHAELSTAIGLRADIGHGLRRTVWAMRRGRAPAPTRGVRTVYFKLGRFQELFCTDHAGALLTGSAGSKGTRALLAALDAAEAAMLVVDGTTLHEHPEVGVAQARRLVVALRRRLHGLAGQHRFPVVLAVTHADLLPAELDAVELTSMFDALRTAGSAGAVVDGVTVPVVSGPSPSNAGFAVAWCLRRQHAQADELVERALAQTGRSVPRVWSPAPARGPSGWAPRGATL
jgi:hypothetical protein